MTADGGPSAALVAIVVLAGLGGAGVGYLLARRPATR
jgi:hypothetical protein